MKVWPIDPLVPRNLRLEVPEKLPQGLKKIILTVPGDVHQLRLVDPRQCAKSRAGSPAS